MPDHRRFRITVDQAGTRLDVLVAGWLDVSRSQAAAAIDAGRVTIDRAPAVRSARPPAGAVVEVQPSPAAPTGAAGVEAPPVRYEDQHLLVVAKPAGLVVHPGTGNPTGTMVQTLVAAGVTLAPAAGSDRPGIVHRLDRDTSGLLVVAKTDAAYRGLVDLLKRREVTRRYVALAQGRLPATSGRIEVPIGRDPSDRQRFAGIAGGKPAVTSWRSHAEGRAGAQVVTLLRCRLETGRTHQIRVHLAYVGAPVVGDRRYGASAAVADELGLDRPFLHAEELAFEHPITGARVELVEPLPADLVAARDAAGLLPIEHRG